MARGNQRDKSREANLKKAAAAKSKNTMSGTEFKRVQEENAKKMKEKQEAHKRKMEEQAEAEAAAKRAAAKK